MFTVFENFHLDDERVIASKAIAVGTLKLQSEGLINLVTTPSNHKTNRYRSHKKHWHKRNYHRKHWWNFKHHKHNK